MLLKCDTCWELSLVPSRCGFNSLYFSCLRSASMHVDSFPIYFISVQNKWLMSTTQNSVFSFVFLLKTVAEPWSFPSSGIALPLLKRCVSIVALTRVFHVYSGELTYCSCITQLNARGVTTALGEGAVDTLLTKSSHLKLHWSLLPSLPSKL